MRAFGLPSHHPEADLAPLHLADDHQAVADGNMDPDIRVFLTELGGEGRKEVFAGDGAGGQGQFAAQRDCLAPDLLTGLAMQLQDALGVLMQTPAGVDTVRKAMIEHLNQTATRVLGAERIAKMTAGTSAPVFVQNVLFGTLIVE